MPVAAALAALGGVATGPELRSTCSARSVRRAVASGEVLRLARNRYALPTTAEHLAFAHARSAVSSHLSAAQHHGWKVKEPPREPWLTVPRNRKVPRADRGRVHWADLSPGECDGGVTAPLRTVLDCARGLPFDEALAVADSALRAGDVEPQVLRSGAAALRGPGAGAVRRVAALADARAANPLESVLRAVALEFTELRLVLQHVVAEPGVFAVLDLADPARRLALEAEGYEYHGRREDWRRDCARFTGLAAHGWSSLRFPFEWVMHDQDRVRWALGTWLRTHGRAVAS